MKALWVCGRPAAPADRGEQGNANPRTGRLGFLGGTFDPPHVGHLIIAEAARVALDLDKVLFVPAGLQPHKMETQVTPPAQRWEMVQRAIQGNEAFEACDLELRRTGPSYTADTVAELREAHSGRRMYFVCGADALEEMASWHNPGLILSGAVVAVARRPGAAGTRRLRKTAEELTGKFGGVVLGFPAPLIHVSSTLIRAMAARGEPIRYLVPERVYGYIRESGLYTGGIEY